MIQWWTKRERKADKWKTEHDNVNSHSRYSQQPSSQFSLHKSVSFSLFHHTRRSRVSISVNLPKIMILLKHKIKDPPFASWVRANICHNACYSSSVAHQVVTFLACSSSRSWLSDFRWRHACICLWWSFLSESALQLDDIIKFRTKTDFAPRNPCYHHARQTLRNSVAAL